MEPLVGGSFVFQLLQIEIHGTSILLFRRGIEEVER
jgi:hypothetical protein